MRYLLIICSLLLIIGPALASGELIIYSAPAKYDYICLHNARTELQYPGGSVVLEPVCGRVVNFSDVVDFLNGDKTEHNIYSPSAYVCTNFASDLYNNAGKHGIKCKYVRIGFFNRSVGHAINAFNTLDRGVVFVQSQGGNDSIVNVSVGAELTWANINGTEEFNFSGPHIIESVKIYS